MRRFDEKCHDDDDDNDNDNDDDDDGGGSDGVDSDNDGNGDDDDSALFPLQLLGANMRMASHIPLPPVRLARPNPPRIHLDLFLQ